MQEEAIQKTVIIGQYIRITPVLRKVYLVSCCFSHLLLKISSFPDILWAVLRIAT